MTHNHDRTQADPSSTVPTARIKTPADGASVRPDGEFVVYWMTAQRRIEWNFALQRAVDWSLQLDIPLLIFEPLRCDYRWASDRLHTVILQGMADHRERLHDAPGVTYLPWVEDQVGDGKGLLAALGERAAVVVTDWFPSFFLPRMLRAAADQVCCRLEAVDSNGLVPLTATQGKVFARAVDFRRWLQKNLQPHLFEFPLAQPLDQLRGRDLDEVSLPAEITDRWRPADLEALLTEGGLADLPIDHEVAPVVDAPGGMTAARQRLQCFVDERLRRYVDGRMDVDHRATSELSPALHFGHISAHEIFAAAIEGTDWTPDRLPDKGRGQREGWWGLPQEIESFFDELITWRELGFNMAWQVENHEDYEALPEWTRRTLEEHLEDEREFVYTLDEFERAATHDEIWNAAQRELVSTGRIHNYLRMLWGKKILHWSRTPREALEVMIELNNKYALDGRNPNSTSGIFWCLGRYDRAWGPERPIFGKVRYMTSDSTRRKMKLANYLERFGDEAGPKRGQLPLSG